MMTTRAIKFAVIILIVAGVIYAAVSASQNFSPPQNNQPTSELPQPAPLFTIKDINGTQISLSDFRGKITVLYFMGTMYDVQVEEIEMLWASYRGKNVVVIGIISPVCSCTVDTIYQVRAVRNFTWFLARDDEATTGGATTNSLYAKYIASHGEPYFPTVVLIDKNLEIERVYGFVTASTLSSEIEGLIEK